MDHEASPPAKGPVTMKIIYVLLSTMLHFFRIVLVWNKYKWCKNYVKSGSFIILLELSVMLFWNLNIYSNTYIYMKLVNPIFQIFQDTEITEKYVL